MSVRMNARSASVMLTITSIVWGSGFIASQFALDAGITPMQLIFGRMFVASMGLNLFFRDQFMGINKADLKAGVVLGICLFGGFLFQTFGLMYTSPSVNAFVTAVYVILIPFFKYFISKDKLDIYSNTGALLTVVGIGLISLTNGFSVSVGIPLTLVCAVFYAMQVIYADQYTKIHDPIKLTIVMINFSALCGLIGSIVWAGLFHDLPSLSLKGAGSIVYLGIFGTFAAYLLQNISQKYTTAVGAAIIMSTEAVFGTILSALIYKETFTMRMLLGCGLIFTAVIISETKLEFLRKNKGLLDENQQNEIL